MGLLDSVLGAVSGKGDGSGGAGALVGVLGGLLAQNGGLQGLAQKFNQNGQGGAFASWVGTGQNQPISADTIHQVLGSEQVRALAAKFGVDPEQAAQMVSQVLPKVVDKLTPTGQIDPNADHQAGLAALLPSLMQTLGGLSQGNRPA